MAANTVIIVILVLVLVGLVVGLVITLPSAGGTSTSSNTNQNTTTSTHDIFPTGTTTFTHGSGATPLKHRYIERPIVNQPFPDGDPTGLLWTPVIPADTEPVTAAGVTTTDFVTFTVCFAGQSSSKISL
jgi:hypothetical protein